ncbi:MAG: Membrane protein insertase YidC [Verrucomicrobiales bacterium]|nr:Membrane protein insertase YidC [Verrucomicrobiales bacterium]
MDRKSITLLVFCFVLLVLWFPVMNRLYPPKPEDLARMRTNGLANAQSNIVSTSSQNTALLSNSTNSLKPWNTNAPENTLVLSNEVAIYTFSSRGGGIKFIELTKYTAAINCARKLEDEYKFASLNTKAFVPAFTLGGSLEPGEESYQLVRTAAGVHAERPFKDGVKIIKEYSISSNYLMNVKIRIENGSKDPAVLSSPQVVIGTAAPMSVRDAEQTVGAVWYNGNKAEQINASTFATGSFMCKNGPPLSEVVHGSSNVNWAAIHNQFFAIAVVPTEPVYQIRSHRVPLAPFRDAGTIKDILVVTNGYQTELVYQSLTVNNGQPWEKSYVVYAGPREYYFLSRLGTELHNNLDAVMNYDGFSGFFAKALLLSMNALHAMGLPYALCVIGITVIIKILFWPLVARSTRSMKRMQTLQPQLKAITEKYKDDPMKGQQKSWEFMKEHKVSPGAGCLPMLLQIPVFFGFYRMLQSAIELRGASFLWACDLSQQDTIYYIPFLNDFPVNILPLIMGATSLYQARLTPPSPGMDPNQQAIMRYMPLLMLVFFYKMSAGLTLYWTVQNLVTIVQTKLTKTPEEPKKGTAVVKKK